MLINPSNFIFLISLFTGTILSVSSSSWLGMWMGLEMNLLSFVPMINNNKNPYEAESAMKYFLIQAMASILFLTAVIMNEVVNYSLINVTNFMIISALMMKIGAAPFHFWFPGVMDGINWINCLILMTWQKIAPFVLLSYKMMSNMTIMVVFMSTLIGSVGGLNQNSLRKVMAYSSISHIGWMLAAMLYSNNLWTTYFIIYSLMNTAMIVLFYNGSFYYLSQMFYIKNNPLIKFSLMISMLSLAGLPPFLGFLPKWLVIQSLVVQQTYMMVVFMVMMTLMTLYYYMRIMLSSFMFLSQEMKWNLNKSSIKMTSMTMIMSIMGIPIVSWMIY